jgi:hypothetical protein
MQGQREEPSIQRCQVGRYTDAEHRQCILKPFGLSSPGLGHRMLAKALGGMGD